MGQQPLQGFRLVMPAFLCCLHNTRLQPSYLTMHIGPIDAVPRHARRRTCPCCSIHLLFSRKKGSTHSLVKRDLREVCPLSRGMLFPPLSIRLQDGLCFFPIPLPALPSAFLTVRLPEFPAAIRAYHVPQPLHE